jgi:hypothetical protein
MAKKSLLFREGDLLVDIFNYCRKRATYFGTLGRWVGTAVAKGQHCRGVELFFFETKNSVNSVCVEAFHRPAVNTEERSCLDHYSQWNVALGFSSLFLQLFAE